MSTPDDPSDAEVVQTAAQAAEDVIFSRLSDSDIEDFDVTVTFEDRILEVDVYINASGATVDTEQVADDAALAARVAVDDLLE
jgi:ribosome-associated translation inhibitor RaiA